MADEQSPIPGPALTPEEPRRGNLAESWREVGEQVRELGNRLALAFRASWSAERSADQEETVRNLRDDLRAAADRLDRVMRRVAEETEGPRTSAFKATREVSERSVAEARVTAISALRSLNRQLEVLVDRLEQERQPGAGGVHGPGEPPPEGETPSRSK